MTDLKRYALVIGNSEYENNFEPLRNTLNDSKDVGKKLETLGFNVTLKLNQTYHELLSAVDYFTEQIEDSLSDIIFYYSGHGCSIQGRNYIIPTDGSISLKLSIAKRTYVELSFIIDTLVENRRSEAIPIVIILDCCRSENITSSKGLIEDEGKPANIFIMYAAGSNQTALDGSGRNGVFTGLLLKHMELNEDIENIATRIRKDLYADSRYGKMQISWTGSSLLRPYSLRTTSKNHDKTDDIHATSLQKNVFWPKYPENPRFVDRPDVFESLDFAIKMNKDNNRFRPIVLCGLGGMGKSQIALKFCYKNKENYRYIFWMDADTETALQGSFLDAAKMLNPSGFDYTKIENIVPQMISWFHNNDGWLLVFDNADDYSLGMTSERLRLQNKYFPKIDRGVILMTTRNNFVEEDGLVINLNDMKMNDLTALKLLLREKMGSMCNDPDALEIIHQFGYLPLAIDLTGALMKMDNLTPADFLKRYNENPIGYLDLEDVQERTGSAYGKTVLTVWNVSFDRIKSKNSLAASLLESTAFLYPDNIPLVLFTRHSQAILKLDKPPSERHLSSALHLLQDFSFIQRITQEDFNENDPAKVTLTVHRLVQSVMLYEKELHEKLQWRDRFISALNQEIPSEDQLDSESSKRAMEVYVPHIRHVITQFGQSTDEQYTNLENLISLLSPTIVYLTRQGLFEGVEYLAELCVSTSERKNGLLHLDTAVALSKLSYVYVCQKRFERAEPHCMQSLKIRRKLFGPMCKKTISALHDLAYIYSRLGMEGHATHLYWEAAIVDDKDAQRNLATRYSKGIGAPVYSELSSYWNHRFLENKSSSSERLVRVNADIRVDLNPLHHAIQQRDNDKIRARITEYKRYVTLGDRDGKTSLHIAAESGNTEIMKFLLNEFQLNKNIQDNQGQTPLHLAVKNGHMMVVKLLMTESENAIAANDINKKSWVKLAAGISQFEIMNFIIHETALADLDFEDIKIGVKGARALAECLKQNTTLTSLDLKRNSIGFDGAHALAEGLKHNVALINLNLFWNNIGVNGARALAEGLKHNTVLTTLDLGSNNIGDYGTRALAEGVSQNISLNNLNLSNNSISGNGARALAEGLKKNTSLTNLNLRGNNISTDGAHALAEGLKQNAILTNLNLFSNNIGINGTCALAEGLKHNTALANLDLGNNSISGDGARALAECLKHNITLTNLNLFHNSIGVDDARALAEGLRQNSILTNMDLSYNQINVDGVRALSETLKYNTTLTDLNLGSNGIGIDGIRALVESLRQNTTLNNLDLFSNGIGVDGVRALAEGLKQNTALTKLDLGSNGIGDHGTRALAECLKRNVSLNSLSLCNNSISDDGARSLAEGLKQNTTLTSLNLSKNIFGDDGARALIESLKQNMALTNLNLIDNTISVDVVHDLTNSLKRNIDKLENVLKISKTNVLDQIKENQKRETHKYIAYKSEGNTIRETIFEGDIPTIKLDLELENATNIVETEILNHGLIVIELDFSNRKLSTSGTKILAGFLKYNTTLTNLNLSDNSIDDNGTHSLAECLKQNSTLTSLDLEKNSICGSGALALAECLKQNTALSKLNLENNSIRDDGANALAECLKQNITLSNLNLSNNQIGIHGVCALAESLKQNTVLTSLNLSRNWDGICGDGTCALAECLKQNTFLINLNLSYNSIDSDNARILAEGLKYNTTLANLELGNNSIGNDGTCALAECLKQSTTLNNLNLKYNSISDDGAHALAEVLKQNTTLTSLSLGSNWIGDGGIRVLAESLKRNTTLINLNLEGNWIGDDGAHSLTECLKQNTVLSISLG